MEAKEALSIVRLNNEALTRPGTKEEFERLTPQGKLTNLGRRIANITERDPEKNANFRWSQAKIEENDGAGVSLELSAHYPFTETTDDIDSDNPFTLLATWLDGKHVIRSEEIEGYYVTTLAVPDNLDQLFARLEESVTAFEQSVA